MVIFVIQPWHPPESMPVQFDFTEIKFHGEVRPPRPMYFITTSQKQKTVTPLGRHGCLCKTQNLFLCGYGCGTSALLFGVHAVCDVVKDGVPVGSLREFVLAVLDLAED